MFSGKKIIVEEQILYQLLLNVHDKEVYKAKSSMTSLFQINTLPP